MSQATALIFNWKSFPIDLADLHMWISANTQHFCGMSADSQLHLWFTAVPSEDTKARIEQYMNALTAEQEAIKIAHRNKLDRAVAYATENLVNLDYSAMSIAERKIFMSRALTLQDKEDLAVKYPFA